MRAEKALNFNDNLKTLTVSYIYELLCGRGKKFGGKMNSVANAVVGGWQVSGVSTFKDGFPLAIGASSNNTGSLGGGQRPDIVGDPHISNPTVERWFNTDAFAQPDAYTFGNGPRTMPNLRAPGQNNWDLKIQEWWSVREEKMRVQFRAEMFNAFNHPYLFAPNIWYGQPTFGEINTAYFARSIQAGLKIYW